MNDKEFIQQALLLAQQGWPEVAPNPMVGCVIVKNGEIVAEGYHQKFGYAHAEVNAINNLSTEINPADCTLYVTLEPCNHFGKTPPCADLIIEKGFKKVVVCNLDPNPLVAGRGIEKLKQAGIEVIIGVLEDEGKALNKRFFTFFKKKRPYYILKWAETADGFISKLPIPKNREENIIGDTEQQIQSHQLRANEMAIMVGKNTVLSDNPSLTTRLVKGKNPIRIFIDRNLEVPKSFNIYNVDAKTLVFNSVKEEVENNIEFYKLDFTKNVLQQISDKLFDLKIQSVIVEGGTFLLNDFLKQKLYDEVIIYKNENLKFGSGVSAPKFN
ncbi:MAG: bifunctional diaminohydroxyphosphoribosylaminopyrimidine deaminase/5-amino-6-(5-phosphoribosylamino)uracil reductase RibD [Bacteroidota bacterium]|nr:bifunctional diaminohydroxyphosphoribosylaminopyrimidine deaminase/5-amino-6-(5-phosphoribosylamino)uracil reductase RibD [Bacteroidota bacterium]